MTRPTVHVSLACWPGLRHDQAARHLASDVVEPLFGRLCTDHVQLVPQNFGVLTEAMVDGLMAAFPQVRFRKHQAFMVVYSLAGIGEGLIREYFMNESATLRATELTVEQFAELLTTMFYRALFLRHPDEQQLKYTRNLTAMVRPH